MSYIVKIEATTETEQEANDLLVKLEDAVGQANAELFDSSVEGDTETEEV